MAVQTDGAERAWFAVEGDAVVAGMHGDADSGLSSADAQTRLDRFGPNSLAKEPPPSTWRIALVQVADPMNIMLIVVAIASIAIGQHSTGILVAVLVLVNVIMGTSQELKARASVEALEELQVPIARVMRDRSISEVAAVDLVPGDLALVEAGDIVPADGRILSSASLEVQEAALTGESAPVAKDASVLDGDDVSLGDRTNMVFQNTSVTRGTATFVITATGAGTQMGKIAGMLQSVTRTRSPLQRELADLTKWLGVVAWGAVALIFGVGLVRGLETDQLILLGVATAIAAIPTGLPTFVQIMLSSGARRLAEAKAVVKNLNDVETLGATSAINSDKTGTLTLNQMTASTMFAGGRWYRIEGGGYEKKGAILQSAGEPDPDFTPLGLGLALCSDATVADDGTIVGDPTEAALVVLAAKAGVDAEITRREHPRVAEVPFDSAYKFMATFHRHPVEQEGAIIELVKGAPDVVLNRCSAALWNGESVPIETVRSKLDAANQELSEQGLRVLSFAFRGFGDPAVDPTSGDLMDQVNDLVFVALVGIIDPLRPSAKVAVEIALDAGIDVRMITGDHAVTAKAIADDLGLGAGVVTGAEFQRMSDDELMEELPNLHVFGRVAPEDKLRLVDRMQQAGQIVAMTGDAVNDAAALKKADIGVAMGSGSEVSKQAAKMILTDDHFSTLVHAVELGRDVYGKISSYIRYQLAGLFGVLSLMVMATVFDVNSGIALTPGMLLFINFFIAVFPVLAIMTDATDPDVMSHAPRDPKVTIFNRRTGPRWLVTGVILGAVSLIPLVWGPDEPSTDAASISMTMAFAVAALATMGLGIVQRRDPAPGWGGPYFPYLTWIGGGVLLTWAAIEMPMLKRWLDTVSLTGSQWLAVLGLALVTPILVEVEKAIRRSRSTS